MAIPFEDSIIRTTNAPKFTDDKFADVTARDAFSSTLRYEGMVVYCIAEKKNYQLQGGILNANWAEYGSSSTTVTAYVDKFTTANGVLVAFTLTATPSDVKQTNVFVGGVYQEKDTYTIVGTTLTFSEAPPTGNNIEVDYNVTTSTIPDDSVTQAKLSVKTTHATAATLGVVLKTASCGTQTPFTSATDIVNATGSLVSKGRPVKVSLEPNDNGSSSVFEIVSLLNPADTRTELLLYRNGSVIMKTQLGGYLNATGVTAFRNTIPCPISFTDVNAPAGTNTYKIAVSPTSGPTVNLVNLCMIAYEI